MSIEQPTSSIPAALVRRAYQHRLEHLAAAAALDVARWEVHGALVERLGAEESVDEESFLAWHMGETSRLVASLQSLLAQVVRHAEDLP